MPFHKYSSIENSYQQKEINYWLDRFPALADEEYILEEKLDGSNVSLVFETDGSWDIAKRSGIVGSNDNFFNVQFIISNKYPNEVSILQSYAKDNNVSMNVYGELFGTGIQKRINYGDGRFYRIFDLAVNGVLLSLMERNKLLEELNLLYMLVPAFGIVEGLQVALDFDVTDKLSKVFPEGGDIIEGIVIKPYKGTYNRDITDESIKIGRPFYLKKKNEKFLESRSKKKRKRVGIDKRLIDLHEAFRGYINENRVLSAFSKYGEIDNSDDIGKYIKIVLEDAKEDFNRDYIDETQGLDKKEMKYIYNVSNGIVEILRKYL